MIMEHSTRVSARLKKEGQSALRHRVRNLRAKVRLLLPGEVCNKHQKRTKNLNKMLHNKSIQEQSQCFPWGHHPHDSAQLYLPKSADAHTHLFHKLTKPEIQQIMEDKLYYLGQGFIDTFDRFLETKSNRRRQITAEPTESTEPQLRLKPSYLATDSSCSQVPYRLQEEEKLVKKTLRLQEIHNKRKLMSEEAESRSHFIKAKMKEREEKRLRNWQEAFAARENSIRRWNQTNAVRTSQSMRVRQRREYAGQMAELSEKLRRLCLQKCLHVRS